MKILNPTTETVLTEIEEDSAKSIETKYGRARLAQPAWQAAPLETRVRAIRGFRDLLSENKERLAQLLTSETGKPVSQARNEINGTLGRIDFFLTNVGLVLQDECVFSDVAQKLEEKIVHEPLGVIANISAWNYPYFVGTNVFIPALLAGNAVLYKPSEFATLTGRAISELMHQAGIPADIFVLVVGTGSVGAHLMAQPINGVFFTGSYPTGVKIAETAAKKLMKTQLELGGKDPVYICEDVDVRAVAEATADGAFYNNGQSCCSVERIYVHEKIYTEFVDHFVKTVKNFVLGDPLKDDTYISSLTRPAQLQVLDHQVQDAVKKGAKVLCGGKRSSSQKTGAFFEPTVLVDVNHTMELMREESFGPVIGVQKVASDAEALMLMNDSTYGLTAGIYTRDSARAQKLLAQVQAGSAYWNCCDRVSPRLPWSGRGHSGIGSTLSKYGILTFVQPKAYHLKST